ncbi:transposase [Streptomyces sp. NPDC005406]|uniref:transposase n=1 Tax=Streptomyces sp. NPDC005406 TaxID=3155339 RepID=UPI0034511F11
MAARLPDGNMRAGVARQYCGPPGELPGRGQCACRDRHSVLPLEWQLYLPRGWTDESERCRQAGTPEGAVCQEKWRLALSLLDNVPRRNPSDPVVVGDAGYGVSTLPSRS